MFLKSSMTYIILDVIMKATMDDFVEYDVPFQSKGKQLLNLVFLTLCDKALFFAIIFFKKKKTEFLLQNNCLALSFLKVWFKSQDFAKMCIFITCFLPKFQNLCGAAVSQRFSALKRKYFLFLKSVRIVREQGRNQSVN